MLIDLETLPHDAAPGIDLANGPPGWPGPIDRLDRRKRPGNISKPDTIAEWDAAEDARHAAALADDVDTQRAEAVEAWARGCLHWSTVRIGLIGWTDGTTRTVIDAEQIGELAALCRLTDAIPDRGEVWTFGTYDVWVLRARMLHHGLRWGPFGLAGKPWDRRVRDLQAVAAEALGGNAREIRGVSVAALAAWLGIEASPGHGSEVLGWYLGGRWAEAIAHCDGDLRVEWEILRRIKEADRG